MIDVVTFKWRTPENFRTQFTAGHVNRLFEMVRRHYRKPFRFSVITDDCRGVSPGIRVIPIWKDYAEVESPYGGRHPACYRRLKLFSRDAEWQIGKRIVCIDLDVVITGDMVPVWSRKEEIIFFKGQWGAVGKPNGRQPYNGSMIMMDAGCRPQVFEQFHHGIPARTRMAGYGGSDQAWFAMCLGHDEAIWDESDGVYSYRNQIGPNRNQLPSDARMVIFHGAKDPWDEYCQKIDWVRKNYGEVECAPAQN